MRDARIPRRRLTLLVVLVVLWVGVILARLGQIHLALAADLGALATRQHSALVELDPVRGSIRDRRGVELALTTAVRSVYAVPALVRAPEEAASRLSRLLGVERQALLRRLRLKDRDFVWVARKVSDGQAEAVAAAGIEGIAMLEEPKRFYPHGALAAHLLGYVGLDNSGLAGIEQQFDADIRGVPGYKLTLRDARGLRFLPEPRGLPAEPGNDLVLSLDVRVQHVVERELLRAVAETRADGAVAIALDPWSGDVLALAGLPEFDPNDYRRARPEARRNPALAEAYEPGSTFKVLTMAAALEAGRLDLDESIDCGNGGIRLGRHRVSDHHPYDFLTPTEVLANSSNVGTIVIGSRVPEAELYAVLRRFGIGETTGTAFPGEAAGTLRPPRQWSALSRPMISMGYEVGVTPMQLAQAFAAVANGGVRVRPRLWLRVEAPDGKVARSEPPRSAGRAIREETAATLVAMMREVVASGTARDAAIPGLDVAGKTGTAKKVVDGAYRSGHYVSSFVGLAPARRPALVVLVALDEPKSAAYYGGLVAAPVVRRILEAALPILGVAAEGRQIELPLVDFYPAQVPAPGPALTLARK